MAKLFQLELDQSVVNCGMSYVIQLDDGSFFIIDGGYFTQGEADNLYGFLSEKSSDKPVIKGWLFTHAHQDHIGCFIDFIEQYHDSVKIETLYYNFQPTRHRFAFGDWRKKCNDLATIKHFYKIIDKYKACFNIHTLKTGEIININELSIEVLYTADNLYPERASFNDYSAVVRLEVSGQSIIFLGDVQSKGSAYLLKNKPDRLKADILQLAHHGFNGATKELYAAINPEVLLFPAPDYEYEKNKDSEVNGYVLNNLGIKEVFVSGYGDCELDLPYELNTAIRYNKKHFGGIK